MSTQNPHLEEQVDAMLCEFAGEIDRVPGPNAAVLARVQAAMRHEMNEQWLAGLPSPEPSPEAMERVRRSVRAEIRSADQRGGGAGWFSSRSLAGLAAAAMLVVGVGLIRQVGYLQPVPQESAWVQAAQDQVDLFVEAAEVAMATDEFSDSVLSELELIYASLTGSAQESSSQTVLDALDDAMQEIFEDAEPKDSTRKSGSWSPRSIG